MSKSIFIKVFVTILIFVYLFYFVVDVDKLLSQFIDIRWFFYVLAYLVNLAGIVFSTLRWKEILNSKAININFLTLFRLYFIGIFFNNFLPGSIGGDTVKMYKVSKVREYNKADLITSVFIDRFVGLLVAYLTGLTVFIITFKKLDNEIRIVSFFTIFVFSIVIFILFNSKFFNLGFRFLSNILHRQKKIEGNPNTVKESLLYFNDLLKSKKALNIFLPAIAFYFLSYIGEVFILLHALSESIPYIKLVLFMPILNLLVMVPISLGGIGVREFLFIYFLAFENVTAETALSLGILLLSFKIVNSIIGAIANIAR